VIVDIRTRPIAHSAWPLHPRDIISIKGRVSRAPRPKIAGELVERLRLLRVKRFTRGDNDKQNCAKNLHIF
jgi:hypothetical protein